jgi:hypothetical protein
MNIMIHYLHQPDENTINNGMVVFGNPTNKTLGWVETEMNKLLIGGDFFVPNRLGIPGLDGIATDAEEDSDYHEPVEFEFTESEPTDPRTIDEFIADMAIYKKKNPLEFW